MVSREQAEKVPGSGEIPAYLSALGCKEEGDEDMGRNDPGADRKKMNIWEELYRWIK